MRFLLKAAFWLGVVLILLPSGSSQPTPPAAQVNAADAMSLASAAAADMRSFCERKPDACVVGSQVALALGYRAQAGAKMLYEFISEQLGPHETGSIAAATSKTMPTTAAGSPSQDTLNETDLKPEWRAPQPRRDPRGDRKV